MGQLSTNHLDQWVIKRILSFLNEIKNVSELIHNGEEPIIKDDPQEGGHGYGIGKIVAERILAQRNQLPARRFREISQLNGIKGFGQDKFNDLAHSIGLSASDAFTKTLFGNEILLSNWTVTHYTTHFPDDAAFYQAISSKGQLLEWVGDRLHEIITERHENRLMAEMGAELIRHSYVDTYDSGHLGSFAWALWFYQFDADNWFTFERIRLAIDSYFNYYGYYSGPDNRIEFHLIKGFPNDGLLTDGITVRDLPITVNFAEQAISIWSAQLFD